MIQVDEPVIQEDAKRLLSVFYEATGYGPSDLLAFNRVTRIFITRNGGRYELLEEGVRHIAGPSPDPSERI